MFPYLSRLFEWQSYDNPSASEVTLEDMGEITFTTPPQNTTKHEPYAYMDIFP